MIRKMFKIAVVLVCTATIIYAQLPKKMEPKFVTITKSKAPWYAFDFLLPKKFREVNPIYAKVDGLIFKAYSINTNEVGKNFGGIYLWQNQRKAQSWFTPKWFEEVKQKRGVTPTVDYYEAIADTSFLPNNTDYSIMNTDAVAIFVHDLSNVQAKSLFTKHNGVFRAYWLKETNKKEGLILFFESDKLAREFVSNKKLSTIEYYKVPVMLKNTEL